MPTIPTDLSTLPGLVNDTQIAFGSTTAEQTDIDFGTVEISPSPILLPGADIDDIDSIVLGAASLDAQPVENLNKVYFRVISGSIGEEGDGIRSITVAESQEDRGANVVTITLSNGQQTQFSILNGSKGSKGDNGAPGRDADIEGANQAIDAANQAAKNAGDAAQDARTAASAAENVDAVLEDDILSVTNREGETKQVNVKGPKGDDGASTVTSLDHYTLQQYLRLKEEGRLQNIFYSIYNNDDVLTRVYLGATLVGKKAEDGERVTVGAAFPLVFPIIFA